MREVYLLLMQEITPLTERKDLVERMPMEMRI